MIHACRSPLTPPSFLVEDDLAFYGLRVEGRRIILDTTLFPCCNATGLPHRPDRKPPRSIRACSLARRWHNFHRIMQGFQKRYPHAPMEALLKLSWRKEAWLWLQSWQGKQILKGAYRRVSSPFDVWALAGLLTWEGHISCRVLDLQAVKSDADLLKVFDDSDLLLLSQTASLTTQGGYLLERLIQLSYNGKKPLWFVDASPKSSQSTSSRGSSALRRYVDSLKHQPLSKRVSPSSLAKWHDVCAGLPREVS